MYLIASKFSIQVLVMLILIGFVIALPYLPPLPTSVPGSPSSPTLTAWNTPPDSAYLEPVTFYASYVNGGNPILGATCTLDINTQTYNMIYNSTSEFYERILNDLPAGITYNYVVTCDSIEDYGSITVSTSQWCEEGQVNDGCDTGNPGICGFGRQTCGTDNRWGACTNLITIGQYSEVCDNGDDDDCDGLTDEDDWQSCNDAPSYTSGISDRSADANVLLSFAVSASDPESDTLSLWITNEPTGAALVDDSNGGGIFSWTPTTQQAGSYYDITFMDEDEHGAQEIPAPVVRITVGAVNIPPVFTPVPDEQVDEGGSLTFQVRVDDSDSSSVSITDSGLPTGMSVSTISSSAPTWINEYSWNPGYGQSGSYLITFTAFDGDDSSTEPMTITVGDINQAPSIDPIPPQSVNEGETLMFSITSSDPDGDPVQLSASNLPTGASFIDNNDNTGNFSWSPTFGQDGFYQVSFSASDGNGGGDTEQADITVGDVNRPPLLTTIGSRIVDEGNLLTFVISATDPDGDDLTFSASNLPTGATFNATSRNFSWTPSYDQTNQFQVIFRVVDTHNAEDSEEVTITVGDVNRAPILNAVGNRLVNEGEVLSFTLTGYDPDNDPYTFSSTSLADMLGAILDSNTGDFSWTPDYNYNGPQNIQVTFFITDDELGFDSEEITITVGDVNRPPVLGVVGSQQTLPDQLLSFTVTATDPDNDLLSYSIINSPTGAIFNQQEFNWTPVVGDEGNYFVTFVVSDGYLLDNETVTVTVGDVNRPPVLSSVGDREVEVNNSFNFTISAIDPDGDDLTYSVINLPANASFNLSTRTFSWYATNSGSYDVTFFVVDNGTPQLNDSEQITLLITEPELTCSDGTPYDQCSTDRPEYCLDGELVNRASICGCPSGRTADGNSCVRPSTPSSSGGGGGGSGGGYYPPPTCTEDWLCTGFGDCINDFEVRTCNDLSSCGTTFTVPSLTRTCNDSCSGTSCDNAAFTSPGNEVTQSSSDSNIPKIAWKNVDVTIGEPVTIYLSNDGTEVWQGLILEVEEKQFVLDEILLPKNEQAFEVWAPMESLLTKKTISVKLYHEDILFDSTSLPVKVDFPEYGVFVDPFAKGGPKLFVVIDNSMSNEKRVGLEAGFALISDGDTRVYEDFVGPFKTEAGEILVSGISLPARYLSPGDYSVEATFFEKGKELDVKTTSSFVYGEKSFFSFVPIIILLAVVALLLVLFLGIDMIYNKKTVLEAFSDLGSLFSWKKHSKQ